MTRVVTRLTGVLEASFCQIFCGFLNTEGFWFTVFIPVLSLIIFSYSHPKTFGASDWGFLFVFSVSFSFDL